MQCRIPPIVRKVLLDIHDRTLYSKSDSNIKSPVYRSSNFLLHSPTRNKPTKASKEGKKKKPLSLQNSQEKNSILMVAKSTNDSTNIKEPTSPAAASTTSNLRSFYDELRAKFFQSNSNNTAANNSGNSGTSSASMLASTFLVKQRSPSNTESTTLTLINRINESEQDISTSNSQSDPTSMVTVINTQLDNSHGASASNTSINRSRPASPSSKTPDYDCSKL